MRKMLGAVVVGAVLLVPVSAAQAAREWWVSPVGSGTSCTSDAPCSYGYVASVPPAGGDSVVFRGDLGTYGTATTPIPTVWTIPAGVTYKGAPNQPRPVLWTSASPYAVRMATGGSAALSNFHIEATADTALLANGTVDRVIANAPNSTGCSGTGGATPATSSFINTVCSGEWGFYEAVGSLNLTVNFRNSTLFGTNRGMFLDSSSAPLNVNLTNTIVRRATTGAPDIATDNGPGAVTVTADHSNYATATTGSGDTITPPGSGTNQIAAPVFTDVASLDFTEAPSSPTINAGIDSPLSGALDLAGVQRAIGSYTCDGLVAGAPDIGAYEYVPPVPPCVPDIPPPPSNAFQIGKLKRNLRKGTAKVKVTVAGAGNVVLAGKRVKRLSRSAAGAGALWLPVKASGRARRSLLHKGKATLGLRITFTPTGGSARTMVKKVALKKRR